MKVNVLVLAFCICFSMQVSSQNTPLVINTWAFTNATIRAWQAVNEQKYRAIDSIVEGCTVCEREQCDGTVGYGGSPDENGETALDAMIMDGKTMNIGAVAALRYIKAAISVARHVLENTKHTMLVGDQATAFAVQMGYKKESLATDQSQKMWLDWKKNRCQPNFWKNVSPTPSMSCGPYEPISNNNINRFWNQQKPSHIDDADPTIGFGNHDTIGMIVIDTFNNIAAGTSTNGARNKIPGRVGDSAIPGSGAYADNLVGAASATGDGDVMMRFMPSLLAVEDLRRGLSPHEAGENALRKIAKYYPNYMGGIVVAKIDGTYGAACHGLDRFPFSVFHPNTDKVLVEYVDCFV